MIEIPQTVFRYERMTLLSLRNLKRHSIYFSSPAAFNDPYDCAVLNPVEALSESELSDFRRSMIDDPEVPDELKEVVTRTPDSTLSDQIRQGAQKAADSQREKFLRSRGVACFSVVLNNLLMWSHYGDACRGFCLEFRTEYEPFNQIQPVVYSDQLPSYRARDLLSEEDNGSVLEPFRWKSKLWSYEEEWRAFHAEAGSLYTYKPEALKAIYFGPDIEEHDLDLICLILAGQNPGVELFRGMRSPDEYKVDFRQFNYTTLVEARRLGLA